MKISVEAQRSGTNAQDMERQEQALRSWFAQEKLDPNIIHFPPQDAAQRIAALTRLAAWVSAWRVHRDRRKMEVLGYDFPPVDPDYDPDTDWLIFELWAQGQPIRWNLAEEVRDFEPADRIASDRAGKQADYIARLLEDRGVSIDLPRELPAKVRYAYLLGVAREEQFHPVASGSSIVLGCDAYCPGCLQRLWCEIGLEMDWPEDEDAGELVISGELKKLMKQTYAGKDGR